MAAADPGQSRQLTRQLSLGGLLTAFILILLAVKVLLPTGDLALLCLTSLCLAIGVIELDHSANGNGTQWQINKPGWPKKPSLPDVKYVGPTTNSK